MIPQSIDLASATPSAVCGRLGTNDDRTPYPYDFDALALPLTSSPSRLERNEVDFGSFREVRDILVFGWLNLLRTFGEGLP